MEGSASAPLWRKVESDTPGMRDFRPSFDTVRIAA